MNPKNYFAVLSNSYVTFQKWKRRGTVSEGTVSIASVAIAFSMHLAGQKKCPGARMPLLLLIFMV